MSALLVNEGRPVFVTAPHDRIGRGPWARWLATAVVPDEGSARAERGRTLARSGHVHSVAVATGRITARVIGSSGEEYDVTLAAGPVTPRVWAGVSRSAHGKQFLQGAVEGREQSVHLEHLMTTDWGEPLTPRARDVRRSCTCPDADVTGACKHVAALAYVVADAIDGDPSLLLHWRGCATEAAAVGDEATEPAPRSDPPGDPWAAGPLPTPRPARALPVGAVLKRLGPSGLRAGGNELTDVLQPAYTAFAASAPDP